MDFTNIPNNNVNDYIEFSTNFYETVPDIAIPLIEGAKDTFTKIEKLLYSTPSIVNTVKNSFPEISLQAVLTDEQKKKLAEGTLKLMTKKDGTLLAAIVDPKNKKIVKNIPLKSVAKTPELNNAMMGYAMQMQMAQIAEQIQSVKVAIEDVRKGQENDRLALAYSCQQKLLQSRTVNNRDLKSKLLLQVISDAEDSRNLLMLSQKINIKFLVDQPDDLIGKFFKADAPEKIESRMDEIRDSLNAINIASLSEAIAYFELGELEAARKSLNYFSDFIKNTYLSKKEIVQRLDLMDSSPINYWSKILPTIENAIHSLPVLESNKYLEENYNGK